ncbi:MAG: hypothetical protein A4E35_01373 [Methanoregula sp. PtaU1.Bin051]|nr:MAG: hypothetical protein A4E35_01373 [Methanoregula sp. PtaU1.Bin051]
MEISRVIRGQSSIQWWQVELVGAGIILCGIIALLWTPEFIEVLVPLFALLALFVGIIMVIIVMAFPKEIVHTIPVLLAGGVSAIAALVAILLPFVVAPFFVILVGLLAIIDSVLLIVVGCTLPDVWKGRILIVLFGMITLFLGTVLALNANFAPPVLARIWGIFAWMIGVLCIVAGAAMRDKQLIPPAGHV